MNNDITIENLHMALAAYGNARYSWWFSHKNKNYFDMLVDFNSVHQDIKKHDDAWHNKPWYQYWFFRFSSPLVHRQRQKQRALLCHYCATLYLSVNNQYNTRVRNNLASIIHYHAPRVSYFSRIRSVITQFSDYLHNINNIESENMNNRQNQNTFRISQAFSCNQSREISTIPTQQNPPKKNVWDKNTNRKLQNDLANFVMTCDYSVNKMNNLYIMTDIHEAKFLANEIKKTIDDYCVSYVSYYHYHQWDLKGFIGEDDINDWEGMTTRAFSNIAAKATTQVDDQLNAWLASKNTPAASTSKARTDDDGRKHESPSDPTSPQTTPDSSASEAEFDTNATSANNTTHTTERKDTALLMEKNEKEDGLQAAFYQQGLNDLELFKNKISDWQIRLLNYLQEEQKSNEDKLENFLKEKKNVQNEMKTEYKNLCFQYHPDKNPQDRKEAAEDIFKDLRNITDDFIASISSPETLAAKVNGGFTTPAYADLWRDMQAFSRRMDEDNRKMRADLDQLEKEMAENKRQQQIIGERIKKLEQDNRENAATVEEFKRDSKQLTVSIDKLKHSQDKIAEASKNQDIKIELLKTSFKEMLQESNQLLERQEKFQYDFQLIQAESKLIEERISRLEQEQKAKQEAKQKKQNSQPMIQRFL